MFAWLFLAFLFLVLLRMVAADMQPSREEKLFYLLLGIGLLIVEVFANGISWLAIKINSGLGILPIINYPLCSIISLGIIWLLFSIIPSWREEDKMEPGFKPIKFITSKVPVFVIIGAAFLIGVGMQGWRWHLADLEKKTADVAVKLTAEQVAIVQQETRQAIAREVEEEFLARLAKAERPKNVRWINLKVRKDPNQPNIQQSLYIYVPGYIGPAVKLVQRRGEQTIVPVQVPQLFYAKAIAGEKESPLIPFELPNTKYSQCTLAVNWQDTNHNGESEPFPFLLQ